MSQYLVGTTLVTDHTLSRSDYFSIIKQKYLVYVGPYLVHKQILLIDKQRACRRLL